MAINKWDSIKSWSTLKKEVEASNLTCLFCKQGFDATKTDSYDDNGWGLPELEEDDPNYNPEDVVGQYENQDWQTSWKIDVMYRLLEENLDFGKFNETEEEIDQPNHSELMEIRSDIVDQVAEAWVFADNGLTKDNENYVGNTVNSIETAQKLTNELIGKIKYENK